MRFQPAAKAADQIVSRRGEKQWNLLMTSTRASPGIAPKWMVKALTGERKHNAHEIEILLD
jgi:hypothetical protein